MALYHLPPNEARGPRIGGGGEEIYCLDSPWKSKGYIDSISKISFSSTLPFFPSLSHPPHPHPNVQPQRFSQKPLSRLEVLLSEFKGVSASDGAHDQLQFHFGHIAANTCPWAHAERDECAALLLGQDPLSPALRPE